MGTTPEPTQQLGGHSNTARFLDRRDAGRRLATLLVQFARAHPLVLGVSRGGVPVAYEVARALGGASLAALAVCKVGAPGKPEHVIGAVVEGGLRVINTDDVRRLRISSEEIEAAFMLRHEHVVSRGGQHEAFRLPIEVAGRAVIVVDDGVETGVTARAALRAVRQGYPRRLVLGVPVGVREAVDRLRREANQVVCLQRPELSGPVGSWYEHFEPVEDAQVAALVTGGGNGA